MTARQKLLALWFSLGLLPLALQVRSYAKFAKPHTIPEILVVQPDLPKQTANLSSVCPVEALQLVGLWWNFEPTHYYTTENGIICHSVVPRELLHRQRQGSSLSIDSVRLPQ
ncbi:hypothetical protein PHYSODRAFT_306009 [Phytophthora sojae]|uniref:Uncharacterized protein n=1 Tax=Phytophthora sojae (strain P6497) TaxID=1094619 RepID=G5A5G0_PHYSP|nr:hypothetical protein PHYSODRAFT_306009 [Phytophthora sojae]EGZ09344.1 hypothetical protein PHYSODRAFT_306009 [Phytophthora sojae]|eukprot:XP_009535977.1 hypothetical protein PHYSODRAFT_306009 [Phytophthora sojae]